MKFFQRQREITRLRRENKRMSRELQDARNRQTFHEGWGLQNLRERKEFWVQHCHTYGEVAAGLSLAEFDKLFPVYKKPAE